MAPSLSVLIPARNEIYLEKTIRNILENAEGDIEILVALDGYLPDPPFDVHDNRVIFYPIKEAVGHRAATNLLAREAKGKFIMKIDAHCAVDKGFDVILAADCKYDETQIPRMYNLDVETWKPKLFENFNRAVRLGKLHDYLYMAVNEKNELRAEYYKAGNVTLHQSKKDILIDDAMCGMGPCFFMHKDRFFEQGGCDEWMGKWGQQAVEVACKAWLSGGSLKVNKKTWFAHWFRHDLGWPYPISGHEVNKTRRETTDFWINDKWPLAKRKFQWLVDKFDPPGWKKEAKVNMDTEQVLLQSFAWRKVNLPWFPRKGGRARLAELFSKLGYKEGVEIGTRNGDYAEVLCKANPDLHLTCIDPFHDKRIAPFYEGTVTRLSAYNVTMIKKTSMDAVDSFKDRSLDFVYIDGDHAFDSVVMDLIKWTPKVRPGGIVSGHDYDFIDVRCAFEAYVRSHNIQPWYQTREYPITAFWVVK